MSKKVTFYSEKELQTIQSEIKQGNSVLEIAKKYAKSWNRNEKSLLVKIYKMIRTGDTTVHTKRGKKPAKVVVKQQPEQGGVTLRSGFVFDFKPQRAEMHQDHVRLYF